MCPNFSLSHIFVIADRSEAKISKRLWVSMLPPVLSKRDLRDILRQCNSRNSIMKSERPSLLGKLLFAAQVAVPGLTFMRRLRDIKAKYDHPKIKLCHQHATEKRQKYDQTK